MYAEGRMQWTTGDNSGGYNGLSGTEALAGFYAGNGINYYTIAGSRTSRIIDVARTTNIDIPGTWIFKVGGVYVGSYVYYLPVCGKYTAYGESLVAYIA